MEKKKVAPVEDLYSRTGENVELRCAPSQVAGSRVFFFRELVRWSRGTVEQGGRRGRV
ncbi:hypothetical protein M408DRAFT_249226 [Serendipita vermifera MAFF 305830]|uniref:Uncharacterized protein n=1 Tax=Serendipita vermifera MAFF 305830 TaxID=933852 RepID=A0A0C2WBM5_SERVB|nr:hypothetical protein M408DRAFT_249226 [Serendipita vermifera MAFF 305830]